MKQFLFAVVILVGLIAAAKEQPIEVVWPPTGNPVLRFTFSKPRTFGKNNLTYDVMAENLWGKPIKTAEFSVYFFDKAKVRIGEGFMQISNVAPAEKIKFELSATTSGTPASMTIAPRRLPVELQALAPAREIGLTVNSVPQGAVLAVDGKEVGSTPKLVQITPGKHVFHFVKDGFRPGDYTLEVGSDDVSGGNISYELGTAATDTVELRDGSVISGDLQDLTATQLRIRVGGQDQIIDRNKVKRILLIERLPLQQD